MKRSPKLTVGVVAEDPLRSVGLQTILEENAGLRTCALGLQQAIENESLDVVLVDIPSSGSVPDTLARLRRDRPSLRVVVVGESIDPMHIQAVIGAGAKGYLPATANEAEIRMAIEVVLDGSVWAPRKVLARLIEAGGTATPPAADRDRVSERMTVRERDVLKLLMEGRNNRQIAESMKVEPVTVKAHLGRMLRKAGVKNRVELTLKAISELQETEK